MNLQNISFSSLFFFLIECYILEIASQTKNSRVLEPCFEEDENLAKYSRSDNSCDLSANVAEVKLVRLPGLRVSNTFTCLMDQMLRQGMQLCIFITEKYCFLSRQKSVPDLLYNFSI